jgi:asparagine synthetase B (glutamine-hydrolysing)
MAYGLEVRPPLLDHQLLQSVFRIPAKIRCPRGSTKYLLRKLASDLVPRAVLHREKKGFSAPLSRWFDPASPRSAGVRGYVAAYLAADDRGLIERRAWGAKYWGALVLEEWAHGSARALDPTQRNRLREESSRLDEVCN